MSTIKEVWEEHGAGYIRHPHDGVLYLIGTEPFLGWGVRNLSYITTGKLNSKGEKIEYNRYDAYSEACQAEWVGKEMKHIITIDGKDITISHESFEELKKQLT